MSSSAPTKLAPAATPAVPAGEADSLEANSTLVSFKLSEPLGLNIDTATLKVDGVVDGGQAERLGVAPLSRIVEIDGFRVGVYDEYAERLQAAKGAGADTILLRFLDPSEAAKRPPPSATTPQEAVPADSTEGDVEMNLSIMEVMSMYDDEPQDGVISPVEFAHLVGDLLCLRDGLLWQPTEFVRSVASALAQQIQHEFGAPVVHFEARHFLWLARSWPTVLEAPTVFHVGGSGLLPLGMEGLAVLLQRVRDARAREQAMPAPAPASAPPASTAPTPRPLRPTVSMRLPPGAVAADGDDAMPVTWVHLHAKCRGAAVSTDAIEQAGGWRFVDHGDGFGLVYWFPPEGAPERDRLLRDSIVGLPVQRLGTAGAPTLDDDDDASVITTAPPPGVFTDAVVTELGAAPRAPAAAAPAAPGEGCEGDEALARALARDSSAGSSSAAVVARLASLGLVARDVGAGGDCFFRCIAAQHVELMYDARLHMRARWRTVQHMRTHRAEFEPFIPEGEQFDAYVERMGTPGTWIEGQTEILAAACAWNLNIRIWGRDEVHDQTVGTPTPDASTRFVQMLHQYEQHYQVVEPQSGSAPGDAIDESGEDAADERGRDALSEYYKD